MLTTKVTMPLMCWRCLSKNMQLGTLKRFGHSFEAVRCRDCSYTITRKNWMKKAQGAMPNQGMNHCFEIVVTIPKEACG